MYKAHVGFKKTRKATFRALFKEKFTQNQTWGGNPVICAY